MGRRRRPGDGPMRPKRPPRPIMRLARPGMEEMIERLQKMELDERRGELLGRARSWPRFVAGLPKDEIKEVRLQAGEMLEEFNRRYSDEDGGGRIRTH